MIENETTAESAVPVVRRRGAFTTFCDDVRHEINGKLLIIGAYGELLQVEEFPAFLPQLAIYTCIWTPIDQPFKKLITRIFYNDDVIHEDRADADLMLSNFEKNKSALMEKALKVGAHDYAQPRLDVRRTVRFVPFALEKEGVLRVRVETDSEVMPAGGLIIRSAPKEHA